ncbi:MAG: hypothetical protein ACRERC_04430 [Candidatus Binatia bacterium]
MPAGASVVRVWSSMRRRWALVTLLLPAAGSAADVPPERVARYSVGRAVVHGDAAALPPFTLLDRDWRLPPIETIEVIAVDEHDVELSDRALHAEAGTAGGPTPGDPDAPIAFSLSERLTTELRYRHSALFGTARSEQLRNDELAGLAQQTERDVVDLALSWRLAGNTVGVGYQLQSARTADDIADLSRFLPGSQQATHALTLGLRREWGAAPAPAAAAPLLPPGLSVEAAATPTAGDP